MCRFVIPVQVAVIFSFCSAWDLPLDKLIPESDYKLSYEDDKNIDSPTKLENKFELAENFTQFLQRENNKQLKPAKPKDSYSAHVRSEQGKKLNNKKTTLTNTRTGIRELVKLTDTHRDSIDPSTGKHGYTKHKNDTFLISTKKTEEPIKNVIVPNMNLFETGISHTEDEGFQFIKLLDDEKLDYKHTAMKRFRPKEKNLDLVTNNLQKKNSAIKIDSNHDVFNLQKIYAKEPPKELPILKHIAAGRNSTTTTTKSFILKELQKKIKHAEANSTPKNEVNSDIILHETIHISNEPNNILDKKPHSTNKRDTIEDDNKQTIKLEKILNRENQIIDLLQQQTQLLEHVANYINTKEQEKEAMRSAALFKDFENILDEVDKKREKLGKGTNMTQEAVETVKKKSKFWKQQTMNHDKQTTETTTQKRMLATVKTVVDETEVRNALRNDPYVQRILKFARRKRLQYLKEA